MPVIEDQTARASGVVKAIGALGLATLAGCHTAPGAGREIASAPPPPSNVSVKDDAETESTTDEPRDAEGGPVIAGVIGSIGAVAGQVVTPRRQRPSAAAARGTRFILPHVGAIQVEGTRVTDFHYLRDDLFRDLGNSDVARTRRLQRSRAFGPFATGNAVNVFVGDIYYFFPVCGGQVRLKGRQSGQIRSATEAKTVRLTCP